MFWNSVKEVLTIIGSQVQKRSCLDMFPIAVIKFESDIFTVLIPYNYSCTLLSSAVSRHTSPP